MFQERWFDVITMEADASTGRRGTRKKQNKLSKSVTVERAQTLISGICRSAVTSASG